MTIKIRKKRFHEAVRYSHHDGPYVYTYRHTTLVQRYFYAIVVDGKLVDTALTKQKAEQRAKRLASALRVAASEKAVSSGTGN